VPGPGQPPVQYGWPAAGYGPPPAPGYPPYGYPRPPTKDKNRVWVILGTILLVLIVLGGIGNALRRHHARSESYSAGVEAADSAAAFLGLGMSPELACQTTLDTRPIIPSSNRINRDEAMRGCLVTLKNRGGH